ncbi:hypothetical protein KIW84_065400 [Lathyrus oleraceus]|uniref:Uncharacterized protein n=1 Tax=Pisum sativum TaxID=3888 RepID=A0A9D4WEI9_PEA|nr:hypothetical protein KIW84_065400 [Pisum sativum]
MLSCSSGKRQISHWRQGHKDECCSLITTTREVDGGNITCRASVAETQFGLHEIKGKYVESYDAARKSFGDNCHATFTKPLGIQVQWVLSNVKSATKFSPSTNALNAIYLIAHWPVSKNHKELPCVNPTNSTPKTTALESHVEKPSVVENTVLEVVVENTVLEAVVEKPLLVDKRGQVLDQFQLEAIASSSEIRDALNNKSLQELVRRIDYSPNAENELDKAMADEAFRVFTDKILSTINP